MVRSLDDVISSNIHAADYLSKNLRNIKFQHPLPRWMHACITTANKASSLANVKHPSVEHLVTNVCKVLRRSREGYPGRTYYVFHPEYSRFPSDFDLTKLTQVSYFETDKYTFADFIHEIADVYGVRWTALDDPRDVTDFTDPVTTLNHILFGHTLDHLPWGPDNCVKFTRHGKFLSVGTYVFVVETFHKLDHPYIRKDGKKVRVHYEYTSYVFQVTENHVNGGRRKHQEAEKDFECEVEHTDLVKEIERVKVKERELTR